MLVTGFTPDPIRTASMSSNETRRVTIAIIGVGNIGPRHARSVHDCPDATIACFLDPSPAAIKIAQEYDVPLFHSISTMLEAVTHPDAAIVCTPNTTHSELGIRLLDAGVHILVEKPISATLDAGQRLVDASKASNRQLLVGHHRRFNPYVIASKQALVDDAIGRVIAVSGLWTACKPDDYFAPPAEWRTKAGGGPILINLIHEIDILQYLLGPISRVHAEQTISQRGHDAEEGAAILLRFASGVVGTFILTDATPSSHSFESGTGENPIIPKAGTDFYRLFGTKGTLSVGDMLLSVCEDETARSWQQKLNQSTLEVGEQVPFDEQIQHFVKVVRGEAEPVCSGEDGLSALRICDAIKQAIASGQAVDIATESRT